MCGSFIQIIKPTIHLIVQIGINRNGLPKTIIYTPSSHSKSVLLMQPWNKCSNRSRLEYHVWIRRNMRFKCCCGHQNLQWTKHTSVSVLQQSYSVCKSYRLLSLSFYSAFKSNSPCLCLLCGKNLDILQNISICVPLKEKKTGLEWYAGE